MQGKWFMKKWLVFSAALLMIAVFAVPGNAKEIEFNGKIYDIAEPGETIPGEIILQMGAGASIQSVQSVAGQLGGRITGEIPEYDLYRVKLDSAWSAKTEPALLTQAIEAAKQMAGVKDAFANVKVSIPKPVGAPEPFDVAGTSPTPSSRKEATTKDSIAAQAAPTGNQWHLSVIGANKAGTPPATTPVVAVLDTGVDYNHPDLAGKVILGKDYIDDDMDPMDMHGHGTHCAGLVGAKGAYLVRGVSPNTKILAVRVLDANGSGSSFDIQAGIVWARKQTGVKILSMSFGGYYQEGASDYNAYKKIIDDTVAAGVIPVAAAGNDYNYYLYYYQSSSKYRPCPAFFPNTFTVGATNENDMRAYFSNYDIGTLNSLTFNYNFVDIVAPGWYILSSTYNGEVIRMSGTSMATPIVAGATAFYWGLTANKSKTDAQVRNALVASGTSLGVYNGFPSAEKRVDLRKAVGGTSTGFVGVVYNAQTGRPLRGATVKVTQGDVTATTTTDYEGFFTATGAFVDGKSCTLAFSKTGFSPYTRTMTAESKEIQNLTKPVFMNQVRAAGQWSIIIDNRSYQPGYYEARETFNGRASWFPYNWNMTAGAFPVPFVSSTTLGKLELSYTGAINASPYMAMTTDPYQYRNPATTFVIKPQSGQTYKVYTMLTEPNTEGYYYSWGSYKNNAYSQPAIQARVYIGSNLKATVNPSTATDPDKPYWYIGDITGTTFTLKNTYLATAP
jgi:subtilisin family serine protease